MTKLPCILAVSTALLANALALAQAPPSPAETLPKVVDVRPLAKKLALGESLVVQFSGLEQWRRAHPDTALELYLDGHKLSNVTPLLGAKAEELVFHLEWGNESSKEWAAVLSRPEFNTRPCESRSA